LEHSRRWLCPECFLSYYERKVKRVVEKYRMIKRGEKIGVAVSGGKDSAALLYVLRKLYPSVNLVAVHLNLGIQGYSEHYSKLVRELTDSLHVPLVEFKLPEELGFSIPDFKMLRHGRKICSVCGIVKRYLLNKIAYEERFDKLATGHNLDDMVEVIFNCYLQGDVEQLVRVRPVLPANHPKLVARIKPLCEMTEKENLVYASYRKLPFGSLTCPLSKGNRSLKNKRLINLIAREKPQFKHTLFKSYVKRVAPSLPVNPDLKVSECKVCGMPTSRSVCAFCRLTEKVKEAKTNFTFTG